MHEIDLDEFLKLNKDEYMLVDIRDRNSFEYGSLPGAVNVPLSEFAAENFDKDKKIVFVCKNGEASSKLAETLCADGYAAFALKGGYVGRLRRKFNEASSANVRENAEKSIRKKFHKQLFSRFAAAINEYKLLEENDKVAVCISGGKDSMLMAKLFQELRRHNKFPFELVFLVMDPGYSAENREIIESNAKLLGIPVTVFESPIFSSVFEVEKSPCYLCARMRRGYLYSKARELGCNKIALGHHYDDVIETILMGMLYSGQTQTMMPKLKSTNFEGMELIRPMYLIREDDILRWRDCNGLNFIRCACKFTEKYESLQCKNDMESASKRIETKNIIKSLKKTNPFVESNIFKSVENVNLETIIAYKDKDGKHNFLDNY